MINNILTFEIEDKFNNDDPGQNDLIKKSRVIPNLIHLLDHLDQEKARATFFMLGTVARKFPEVAALIDSRGHEVASHGITHLPLKGMPLEKIEFELLKSKEELQEVIKKPVRGFKSADKYLARKELHIFKHIAEAGYNYDCSYFGHGSRIEINKISKIFTDKGNSLSIIPQSVRTELVFHIRFGEKVRAFPTWFVDSSIRKLNKNGQAAMINMKLWEIDKFHPRPAKSEYINFSTYGNIQFAEEKLKLLLASYKFVSCSEFLGLNDEKPNGIPI